MVAAKFIGQVAAVIAGFASLLAPTLSLAQQSGTITLTGTVAQNCTIGVSATSAASNLDLSGGNSRVQVGTVLQACNKRAGYTLHVASQNCSTETPGAKLIGTVSAEALNYSVEFNNPATGGSQTVVTGLLATACSGASAVTARNVTDAKVSGETSSVYVNYTGNSQLSSDSYADVLTITLVAK
jgi:hypothetical protein